VVRPAIATAKVPNRIEMTTGGVTGCARLCSVVTTSHAVITANAMVAAGARLVRSRNSRARGVSFTGCVAGLLMLAL